MIEYIVAILIQLVQLRLDPYVNTITHWQGQVPVNLICSVGYEASVYGVGERLYTDHEAPGWYWLYYMGGGEYQILVMYQDPKETYTPHVVCVRNFTP